MTSLFFVRGTLVFGFPRLILHLIYSCERSPLTKRQVLNPVPPPMHVRDECF